MELTFFINVKTDLNGKGLIATNLDYSLNNLDKQECTEDIFQKGISNVFELYFLGRDCLISFLFD